MSSKLSSTSQAVWKDIAEFRLAYLTGTPDEISCDILSYERLKFRLKEIVIRELFDQNVEDFNLFHQSEVNKLNEYRTAFCYVASCYGSSSIYEKQPEVEIFQPFFTHYYEDLIMRIENFLKRDINKAILAANTFRLTTTVQMNKKKKVNLHENKNETKDELQNRTAIPVPIDTNTSEIDLNGFTNLVILTKDDFLPFTATESDNNPKIKKRKDEEVSSSDDEGGKAPRKRQKVVVTNGKVDPKAKTIGQGVKMISKQNQSTQQSELVNSFSHLELKTPFGSLYKQPSYQAKDQFIAESLALGDMRYFESQSIVTVKSGLLDMFTLFLLFHVHDENGARRFGMTESIKSDDDYLLILLFFMCETSTEDILYFLDNSNTGEKLETCTNNDNEEQAEERGEEESDEGGESKDDADDSGGGKGIPQRLFKNAFTGKRHGDVSNKENLSYPITERAQALREQRCRNNYFYLDSNSVSSQPSLNDHSKLTWLLNK